MQPIYDVEMVERIPTVDEYLALRMAVGWTPITAEMAQRGLDSSLYSVCAMIGDHLAGHGRVIGDGAIYFYIQDVVVLPIYQRNRIGSQIMDHIMRWLERNAYHHSFIGLMAAQGAASFYHRYGFKEREADRPGMYTYKTR